MSDYLGPDPSEESEDDLSGLTAESIAQAVLNPADWTTETLLNQMRKGAIKMNPPFQRRDAWTPPRKSRFIESLFMGLPIPQIVLAESQQTRGTFLVLDGKQRLLALRQFAGSIPEGSDQPPLVLRGLEVLEEFNGRTYESIESDPQLGPRLAEFENRTIRTVVVRAWPNDEFLHLVFLRLNTGNVPLSPQELRNALHPGPFVQYAEEASAKSEMLKEALGLSEPDFRMRDVEVFVRYIGFAARIAEYRGNLKKFLDDTCEVLNDDWKHVEPVVKGLTQDLERAIEATFNVFGDDSFSSWNGESYEGRFNRAVFDVMTFYFRHKDIAAATRSKATALERRFRALVDDDEEFNEAISATTKSIGATHKRLNTWGGALSRTLRKRVPTPELEGGRIVFPSLIE